MIYYHITDDYLQERIVREGLIGNPVVYLTSSYEHAVAIRRSQVRLGEVIGAAILFRVEYDGEIFIDPHVQPLGTAWMVYDNIPPSCLRVYYSSYYRKKCDSAILTWFAKGEGTRS